MNYRALGIATVFCLASPSLGILFVKCLTANSTATMCCMLSIIVLVMGYLVYLAVDECSKLTNDKRHYNRGITPKP